GSALELPLRGSNAEVSPELDGPTALAAAGAVSKVGADAVGSPGRYSQLLPIEAAAGGRRSHQRQHQNVGQARARIQESSLSLTEGTAHGCHQDGIRRFS